jgi:hypothetical protein
MNRIVGWIYMICSYWASVACMASIFGWLTNTFIFFSPFAAIMGLATSTITFIVGIVLLGCHYAHKREEKRRYDER